MATTPDRKLSKKGPEPGSGKPSQGSLDLKSKLYMKMGDEVVELPPDWHELEEIDYNDPEVKKWLEEEEAERIRKYGRMTLVEAEYMYCRRPELQEVFPEKSSVELNQMALREFREGRAVQLKNPSEEYLFYLNRRPLVRNPTQ